MPKDQHNTAAEHHENAAKSHRIAAEHHGKGEHAKGKEHSAKAQQYSQTAVHHTEQAHSKRGSLQQEAPPFLNQGLMLSRMRSLTTLSNGVANPPDRKYPLHFRTLGRDVRAVVSHAHNGARVIDGAGPEHAWPVPFANATCAFPFAGTAAKAETEFSIKVKDASRSQGLARKHSRLDADREQAKHDWLPEDVMKHASRSFVPVFTQAEHADRKKQGNP